MNGLIRSPFTELLREFSRPFEGTLPAQTRETAEGIIWAPRVDLSETEDAYIIRMDLPGVNKEDISINYQDGTLTVSGERKLEQKEEGENFYHVERVYGRFVRSFTFPKDIDADKIQAKYENGVLIITVPKAEANKPKTIKIS